MKRCLYLVVALVIMLSLLVTGCAPKPPAAEEVTTLRVACIYPMGHPLGIGFHFFMSKVEARTDGRVVFDYYPASTLIKGPDILDGVIAGSAHIGNMVYAGKKAPWIFFTQLPGVYPDEKMVLASEAMYKVSIGGMPEEEWGKLGVKPLYCMTTCNYQIYTIKKAVKSVADFQGVKIRAAGAMVPKAIEGIGGVPVSMPIGEAYEAISKGVVDGVTLAIPSLKPYAFYELIKYANIGFDLGGYPVYFVINLNTWNALPSDIKEIMEKAGAEASVEGAEYYWKVAQTDVDSWKKGGMEVYTLSSGDKAAIKAELAPMGDAWIADVAAKGFAVKKLVEDWKAAMAELR